MFPTMKETRGGPELCKAGVAREREGEAPGEPSGGGSACPRHGVRHLLRACFEDSPAEVDLSSCLCCPSWGPWEDVAASLPLAGCDLWGKVLEMVPAACARFTLLARPLLRREAVASSTRGPTWDWRSRCSERWWAPGLDTPVAVPAPKQKPKPGLAWPGGSVSPSDAARIGRQSVSWRPRPQRPPSSVLHVGLISSPFPPDRAGRGRLGEGGRGRADTE